MMLIGAVPFEIAMNQDFDVAPTALEDVFCGESGSRWLLEALPFQMELVLVLGAIVLVIQFLD